jgi:hypothetical protein
MPALTITVPDRVAEQAKELGLLSEEALVSLIEEALVRRRHINDLFDAADRLSKLDLPAMSPEEVEQEIGAARASRRADRP